MTDYRDALAELLAQDDAPDLRGWHRVVGHVERYRRREAETVQGVACGRGRITTCLGAPDRRSTVFLPLVTRWAQRHYMMRAGEL